MQSHESTEAWFPDIPALQDTEVPPPPPPEESWWMDDSLRYDTLNTCACVLEKLLLIFPSSIEVKLIPTSSASPVY